HRPWWDRLSRAAGATKTTPPAPHLELAHQDHRDHHRGAPDRWHGDHHRAGMVQPEHPCTTSLVGPTDRRVLPRGGAAQRRHQRDQDRPDGGLHTAGDHHAHVRGRGKRRNVRGYQGHHPGGDHRRGDDRGPRTRQGARVRAPVVAGGDPPGAECGVFVHYARCLYCPSFHEHPPTPTTSSIF